MGNSVIVGLVLGGIAVVLALVLNWFRRPTWATTGRLAVIVVVFVVLGALVPLLFRQTVSVSNPPLGGETTVQCSGIASPDGDSVALKATAGRCPGLSVKPGPTSNTLEIIGSNDEPMTLVRSG